MGVGAGEGSVINKALQAKVLNFYLREKTFEEF